MAAAISLLLSCNQDTRSQFAELVTAGQESYDAGDYAHAVGQWDAALQLAPDKPELLVKIANAYQRSGEFDKSNEKLQQAIEKNSQSVECYYKMAQNHILSGYFDSALEICRNLEKMTRRDYRLILLEGDISSFKGDYDEGESLYREAIRSKSAPWEGYFKLAANLLAQERPDDADQCFQNAVNTGDRTAILYWLHRAEFMALNGDAESAEAAMKQALEIEPDDLFIKLRIVNLMLSYKKYESLLAFLGEPAEDETEHPAIEKIRAETLLNTHRLDKARPLIMRHRLSSDAEWMLVSGKYNLLRGNETAAIGNLEMALEKRKEDPNAYYMLALAYIAGDKLNLASQTLIQCLTRFPHMTEAQMALAAIYYMKEDYDLSVDYLERVISHNPENFRAHLLLGNCMLATGQLVAAEQDFKKATILAPQSIPARYNLAWLYLEKDVNLANAFDLARKAFEAKPDNSHFAHTLGWAYHKKCINNQAQWYLNEAIRLAGGQEKECNPYSCKAIYAYHLSLTMLAAGQQKEAKEKLHLAVGAGLPSRYEKRALEILRH